MSRVVQLTVALVETSRLLDGTYPAELCEEARVRRRLDKLSEEVGEVIAAYGGVVGENPRKGVTHELDDVLAELLDVAACALGAYESLDGHQGRCVTMLLQQTQDKRDRLADAIRVVRGG